MTKTKAAQLANFGLEANYDAGLIGVAVLAERYFADDPVACLMKLRQFVELLTRQVAARAGVFVAVDEPEADLLGRLRGIGPIRGT